MSLTSFSNSDIQKHIPALKIGVLGTVNDQGLPHLTLISSLQAISSNEMSWGQFTEGLSPGYCRRNHKTGFLIMSLDKHMWRGKAEWSHSQTDGNEFDAYNNIPMFRYNAYFGIHTVHYMKLVEQTGEQILPMNAIILAAIKTMIAKIFFRARREQPVFTPWMHTFMDKLDNLKFLSYIGADGYPVILPVIQAQAAGKNHILYSVSTYSDVLKAVPDGCAVAVFGMSLQMEDILMRGVYEGTCRVGLLECGAVEVNWVYNSMPPNPGQVYPLVKVSAVTEF